MKKVLLIALLTGICSSSALADTVNWTMLESTVNVYAKNFQIKTASAYMECKLGDADDLFGDKFTRVNVNVEIEKDNFFIGSGNMYTLSFSKTKLKASAALKSFSYCSYMLEVETDKKKTLLSEDEISEGVDATLVDEVSLLIIEEKNMLNKAYLPNIITIEWIKEGDIIYKH